MKFPVPFLFVGCQTGAEVHLKRDLERHHPELSFAFSRPGFVTFKVRQPQDFDIEKPLRSVFARTYGASVGSTSDGVTSFPRVIEELPDLPFRHLHVWKRDLHLPGDFDYEPFHTPESLELGQQLKTAVSDSVVARVAVNRTARVGDYVADLIVVDPNMWFYGWHRATAPASRWPGGVPPIRAPENMVSRAYLKMEEALRWCQFPIVPGDLCVELGSSPGGSCQALLDRGYRVVGIDPAEMHASVLEHANFSHVRARADDLKRKEFAEVRWMFADANIAPTNTLDAVEAIVTHQRVNIRGLLLTLKLLQQPMYAEVEDYLDRIRSWGYKHVRARQLSFNRREICVMATPSKNHLRSRWRKPARRGRTAGP